MNRRIAKKQYKKVLNDAKTARKRGVSVLIQNHDYVDQNGKLCDAMAEGARFITLKRPRIQYIKPAMQ